ncbi:MAG: hypothetical protein WB643_07145 [Candidatus Bathyarchaeia archaeon]
MNTQSKFSSPDISRSWIAYLPLLIGLFVDLGAGLIPPATSAFALAAALTLVFYICVRSNESGAYLVMLTTFLVASVAYNVSAFYQIPLAVDPWTNISVAAAILRTGHFSAAITSESASGLNPYYSLFPAMSIASATLSSVTGLDLPISFIIFPGCIILLQPLLVFVLARAVYGSPVAAVFSAFVVLTESAVTQWITTPLAESVALSMVLLLLVVLLGRRQSRSHVVLQLAIFSAVSILHGAIALLSMVLLPLLLGWRRSRSMTIIATFLMIFLAYLVSTLLILRIIDSLAVIESRILGFFVGSEASSQGLGGVKSALYGAGTPGVVFVWWGLPVALALFSILILGRKGASSWTYVGLGTLGLSYILNVLAPNLVADRYGGAAGWLVLAVAAGKPLATLTRNPRRLLLITPIIFLVCFSAVANPLLSPQYGYLAHNYHWSPSYNGVPLTESDTIALNWVHTHPATDVISDEYASNYLVFLQFQSGIYSHSGILSSVYALTTPRPRSNQAIFVRWWNLQPNVGQVCPGLISALARQQTSQIVNIVYYNNCDVLEMNPR